MDTLIPLAILALCAYFIPTIIAVDRGHHQRGAIIALNVILGWTFLGWAIPLVWSLTATTS